MNDLIAGGPGRRQGHATTASTSTTPRVDPVEVRAPHRHGVPEAEPVPEVDLRQHRLRAPHRRASKDDLDDVVEKALRAAALWDEVKDRLKKSALGLSGGQQQRLCIARAIAVEPEVVLMDEPCSALDPIATARIEDLMQEIKSEYTIVIVTHNMQQAARVSDRTAFFTAEVNPDERPPHRRARRVRRAPTRSSRTRPTSGPRTTSPAASADGGPLRQNYTAELEQLALQVEMMGVLVDQNLERMREVLLHGDSSAWPSRPSPPTTASTP